MREAGIFRSSALGALLPLLLAAVLALSGATALPGGAAEKGPGSAGNGSSAAGKGSGAAGNGQGTTAKGHAATGTAKGQPVATTRAAEMRVVPDSVACDAIAGAIVKAESTERIQLSESAIRRNCRPIPAPTWSAIRYGRWTDGPGIDEHDRSVLLGMMAAARYPEAETLSVELLQTGRWPEGTSLGLQQGSLLIQGLKGELTPYRVRLLLDIYEQRQEPFVRVAVLQALSNSDRAEALLPAVEASLADSGQARSVALGIISAQPEKTAEGVLARLIQELPEGPALAWARRLGEEHPSAATEAALKKRGLSKTE